MPTQTLVREITIPEGHGIPEITDNYKKCPKCEDTSYYEDWAEGGRFYDLPDLIQRLESKDETWLQVGGEKAIVQLLKMEVAEHNSEDVLICPSCGDSVDADQVLSVPLYECPECSSVFESSHTAMMCCTCQCAYPFDECRCRDGVQAKQTVDGAWHPFLGDRIGETHYYRCRCDEQKETGCGRYVCVVCHHTTTELNAVFSHICPGSPKGEEVVAKPGSLPDALTWEELTCACEMGFCCQLHNRHAAEHVFCWS